MKNILTSLILCASCFHVCAQQDRFIYLQTENNQPFFVKLNNKILNSYPSGYLIISKLDDGIYSLIVGFPEADYEQEFNCSINHKDVGFIIKNTGEKKWQLFNLQTQSVIIPGDVTTKQVVNYEKETDPFSTMLANAVHDSTILRKDVAKEIIEKPNEQNQKDTTGSIAFNKDVAVVNTSNIVSVDSTKKEVAKEILSEKINEVNQKDSATLLASNNTVAIITTGNAAVNDSNKIDIIKATIPERSKEINQKDSSNNVVIAQENILQSDSSKNVVVKEILPEKPKDAAPLMSVIKRKLKKSSKEGIEMVYVDDNGESKDTIRVLIPSDKKIQRDEENKIEPVVVVQRTLQEEKPKDVNDNKVEPKIIEKEKEKITEPKKEPVFINSAMINSDCKNFATDDDFLKIRKKMVAENSDENMVRVAKKYFKTKCFTTEQIKNLSVLFLKDEGKYMFFDVAYPFVSDSDRYSILENQLSDNYYITRFRAMIHK